LKEAMVVLLAAEVAEVAVAEWEWAEECVLCKAVEASEHLTIS
jgi:hypothetical protein